MRRVVYVSMLVAFLCLSVPVVAQDDGGPSLCTNGSWYCPDPNDPWREVWNWTCGWWYGHVYAGFFPDVPEWCGGATPTSSLPPGGPTPPVTATLAASTACEPSGVLDVIITSGDGSFSITGSGPDMPQNGVGIGTHFFYGPGTWTGVTVTELGGDGESLVLGDISCYVDMAATALCSGAGDMTVNISFGDGPFNITGTGPDMPRLGVGAGIHGFLGPGNWTGITVTETGGDGETLNLGDRMCSAVP